MKWQALRTATVDVVKIKELMGHASIVPPMRYIHATDQGKRGAIMVLSGYLQWRCRKFVAKEKRQTVPARHKWLIRLVHPA